MTSLERLRLAGALAHSVQGAELRLHTDRDEQIVVGHHPAADLDSCALRQVIISSACPDNADYSQRIVDVDVRGALADMGGGVFGATSAGRAQRWIVSLLRPDRISQLLDGLGNDHVADEAMHACVKLDSNLCVTSLVITSTEPSFDHAIDEVAAGAAAACFVEELRSSIPGLAHNAQ